MYMQRQLGHLLMLSLLSLVLLTSCLNPPPEIVVTDQTSNAPQPTASIIPSPVLMSSQLSPRISAGQTILKNDNKAVNIRIDKGSALQNDGKVSIQFGRQKQ